jgi:hypothetical protein
MYWKKNWTALVWMYLKFIFVLLNVCRNDFSEFDKWKKLPLMSTEKGSMYMIQNCFISLQTWNSMQNLIFSQLWLWRSVSSGMWCCVVWLMCTKLSEEIVAYVIYPSERGSRFLSNISYVFALCMYFLPFPPGSLKWTKQWTRLST